MLIKWLRGNGRSGGRTSGVARERAGEGEVGERGSCDIRTTMEIDDKRVVVLFFEGNIGGPGEGESVKGGRE